MKKRFFIFSTLFLLGCSTGGRGDRFELRNFYATGAYDQGLEFIEKSKYYQDKNERLLTLMEKGMIWHAKGDYEKSSLFLDEARALSNELYTTSISKKAEKTLLNDTYDVFYGEIYERSLLHFYLSLNAILNYQKTKKRDDLFKARAEVLAWDSFLNSVKEDRLGRSVYKNDLLLKIYGAKIHEMIGTREDRNIALQLYKDAKDVLLKNYNTYPSFNQHYKDFKKDFEKLAKLSLDEVKKKYIVESELQKNLKDFIDDNISRLSRPEKKNKTMKEIKTPVTLVLEKGLIAEKVADKSFYSLDFLAKEPLIALFAADVLGLLPSPNSYNPGGAYVGIVVASAALQNIGIGFELPKVINTDVPKKLSLVVLDKDNKEVLVKEVSLINPMGDIAEEAVFESSAWTYTRTGFRLATKHGTAIAASFATYKALGGGRKENDFLARNAAVLQYIGAARAIEESEKADTRYWSTLPNEIRIVDLELNPGLYQLEIRQSPTEKISLGSVEVPAQDSPVLVNIRKN